MKIMLGVGQCRTYIYCMTNTININGIEITASFFGAAVMLTFVKDGKVVKVADSRDAARFVKPENLAKVTDLVASFRAANDAARIANEIANETTEEQICREAKEARDNRTAEQVATNRSEIAEIATHQSAMARTMSVQG